MFKKMIQQRNPENRWKKNINEERNGAQQKIVNKDITHATGITIMTTTDK